MSFKPDLLFNELQTGIVLFAYKGIITSELINDIIVNVEEKLEGNDVSPIAIKKTINVLVEGLQNLYHHIESLPEDVLRDVGEKYGMLVVTKQNDGVHISMGNFVNNEQRENLTEKIEKINNLDDDELKEMYKYILNHQKLSAKGGGGLGLVDMAKKTKNKLVYKFYQYSENNYFFNLNLLVS